MTEESDRSPGGGGRSPSTDDRRSTDPLTPPVEPSDSRPRGDAPKTDLTPLVSVCLEADADALVVIGDRFDDDLRYLTRFSGPDRPFALVVVPGPTDRPARAVLCAPALFSEQATREFVEAAREPVDATDAPDTTDAPFHDGITRSVRTDGVGDPVGLRAAAVLDDLLPDPSDPTVLTPQSIPHDAALHLDGAGYRLASTTAIADARAIKTDAEIDRLGRVQRATTRAMARAETVLAESTPVYDPDALDSMALDEPVLVWNDAPLSTERLRRQVNVTLARYGVRDAGNTVIGAGPSAADLHYTGVDLLRPGETVLLDISPRGPDGYYGDLTRTFVVDGDGGWERRAYVAVEAAREAALATLEPGVTAREVHREAAAELAAYGFDPNAGEGEAGFTHGTGHGVGVSLHEAPSLSGDTELRPGHVVTVEPGVYNPDLGGVRLEDLVAVTDDGYSILASYPFRMVPERS